MLQKVISGHHVGGQGYWGNCGPQCPIPPDSRLKPKGTNPKKQMLPTGRPRKVGFWIFQQIFLALVIWATLGHLGHAWPFGLLWATLGHFGHPGPFGQIWATLGQNWPKSAQVTHGGQNGLKWPRVAQMASASYICSADSAGKFRFFWGCPVCTQLYFKLPDWRLHMMRTDVKYWEKNKQ